MTEQEIFDTVAAHLIQQGAPSVNATSCAYRGDDGKKCAVGVLILDEEYTRAMEERSVEDLFYSGRLPVRLHPHLNLLADLQRIHDDEFAPDNWRVDLQDLAAANDFDTSVLGESCV